MFNDVGPLELVTIVVLAVIVFGPDKLPKVIQDVTRFIRKVREFSDNAKEDIRSELGPEFKDFDFEDLNPKTFVRKQLLDNDDLGLKELRSSFDLRKEMSDIADSVNSVDAPLTKTDKLEKSDRTAPAATSAAGTPDLLKKTDSPELADRPQFDADAT